ncbi:MAG: ABC transporter ATP-binding protein [Defluviitaleaceae bacterium]|nr:ABC transporter ATP-binding protein [Defluviitaleaceae bacterium]MCL2238991.1 ABC transporter ATP-binding protein [Defluviitaleaceae bacterium]
MIITATGVKRGFPIGGDTFWALKGIDLAVAKGKLTVLKGRSGSGKTTLMNILGALDYPTAGDVFFDGLSLCAASEAKRDTLRRMKMGFVFQSVALVSMMTAYENVEFILRISGYPARERRKRVEACLDWVGLAGRMHHLPPELSGGEQQRVAIARAIAHRPLVIFADEPTAELDTNTGLQVIKIFKDLIEHEGATIVMTTHDPGLMEVADKVYELADGEIAEGGAG